MRGEGVMCGAVSGEPGEAQGGPVDAPGAVDGILGESEAAIALRGSIASAARSDATVLLTGETGTGKGLAARAVHQLSARRDAPFVHVDCAGLSAALVESELFGHERGAFTGAALRRAGRFELAGAGTLFLDEIGELPPTLQAKLLRVLQEREFERIGGTRTLAMRARVVAATNRDLARAVRRRRFRADLYFRLKVLHVRLPPLRRRAGDARLIAEAAIARLAPRLGRRPPRIDAACWQRLARYAWPGNVRELTNLVERLLVAGADPWSAELLEGMLEPAAELSEPGDQLELGFRGMRAAPSERDRIAEALSRSGGNVARAARRLDMPRSTLRYRMAKYRLEPSPCPGDAADAGRRDEPEWWQ